jgi:hypothetical protein
VWISGLVECKMYPAASGWRSERLCGSGPGGVDSLIYLFCFRLDIESVCLVTLPADEFRRHHASSLRRRYGEVGNRLDPQQAYHQSIQEVDSMKPLFSSLTLETRIFRIRRGKEDR